MTVYGMIQFGGLVTESSTCEHEVSTAATMYQMLIKINLRDALLNVEVVLLLYLTLIINNCSGEGYFCNCFTIRCMFLYVCSHSVVDNNL